jgi:hypothetical protein
MRLKMAFKGRQRKAEEFGMERSSTTRRLGIERRGFAVHHRGFAGGLFGIFFLICSLMILSGAAWGAVTGSISGTVKDPSGRAVPDAKVTAREVNTGISHETRGDANGYYSLPVLPVGRYELDVRAAGFETCERQDVTLDTDAALRIDCTLKIGEISETVSVTDNALHVETVSTQTGEVIGGREMTSVPLNGRSFTDLLGLQPGVAPETTIGATTVQDVGATILDPSGTLNPGTVSVNGQRETANYFSVNGSDYSQPGCDCGVSHCDEQLRRGVWGVQRRPGECYYQERKQ